MAYARRDGRQRVPLAPAPPPARDPDRRAARALGADARRHTRPRRRTGRAPRPAARDRRAPLPRRPVGRRGRPAARHRRRHRQEPDLAGPRDAAPTAAAPATWRRSDDPRTTWPPCSAEDVTATEPTHRTRRDGPGPARPPPAAHPPHGPRAGAAAVAGARGGRRGRRRQRRPRSRGADDTPPATHDHASDDHAEDDGPGPAVMDEHVRGVLERSVPDLGPVDRSVRATARATLALRLGPRARPLRDERHLRSATTDYGPHGSRRSETEGARHYCARTWPRLRWSARSTTSRTDDVVIDRLVALVPSGPAGRTGHGVDAELSHHRPRPAVVRALVKVIKPGRW